jgi:lycopene cyclase domain-containing protein
MFTYLLINILIIIVPLLLSFENKIQFYKKLKAYFYSIIIVSSVYIIWDAIAAYNGHWGFNSKYILGIIFFYLPLEELMFFITVPYSCIFIYETISLYIKDKTVPFNKVFYVVIAVILILLGLVYKSQYYTSTVLFLSSLFILIAAFFFRTILESRNYWLLILVTYIPFFIVNYFLTSMPIVWYNNDAIWGIRLSTIPLEDFFYSFSMISFWLLFYKYFSRKFIK